ncbi:hypothetical protein PZA11_005363 [Diplocarpon coronariae]
MARIRLDSRSSKVSSGSGSLFLFKDVGSAVGSVGLSFGEPLSGGGGSSLLVPVSGTSFTVGALTEGTTISKLFRTLGSSRTTGMVCSAFGRPAGRRSAGALDVPELRERGCWFGLIVLPSSGVPCESPGMRSFKDSSPHFEIRRTQLPRM